MGLITGNVKPENIYSAKWITAEITDSSKRLHFVPILYTLGDYFMTTINHKLYCFKIIDAKIESFRSTGAKTFRVIKYNTKNWRPIDGDNNDKLAQFLRENQLPKVEGKLLKLLKHVSKTEGHEEPKDGVETKFTPHDLKTMFETIATQEGEYGVFGKNMKNFIENLNLDQIITPTKDIVDYIEGEVKVTSPGFMGEVAEQYLKLDTEDRKVTNSPINAKKSYVKLFLLLGIVAVVVLLAGYAYQSGAFSNLTSMFPQIGGGGGSAQSQSNELFQKYPTPEAMKAAIDRGELDYNTLPPEVKKLVGQVKTPTAAPTPKSH